MKKPEYLCPLVTAFTDKGELDSEANAAILEHVITGGIDGVLTMGSSGEFFAMPAAQRTQAVKETVSAAAGRTTVIAGTGANSVEETVALSREALYLGADAVMVVSPFYFGLSRQDLLTHFSSIAAQIDGPVYLYNFPDRTGNDLDGELITRLLSEHDNIVGIKDTVSDMSHTRAVIEATRAAGHEDFKVYSGMDENFVHNVLAGGNGNIAALSNLVPGLIAAWVKAVKDGDLATVELGQRAVDRLSALYSVAPFFVPVLKYAMSQRGLSVGLTCRASLAPFDPAHAAAVDAILTDLEELLAGTTLA